MLELRQTRRIAYVVRFDQTVLSLRTNAAALYDLGLHRRRFRALVRRYIAKCIVDQWSVPQRSAVLSSRLYWHHRDTGRAVVCTKLCSNGGTCERKDKDQIKVDDTKTQHAGRQASCRFERSLASQ
eukprot:620361-Amphidinium_carterae.1